MRTLLGTRHRQLKNCTFLLIGSTLLLALITSRFLAYSIFNQANLRHVAGHVATGSYQRALNFAPNDPLIRWQKARVELSLNNNNRAAQLLGPLLPYAPQEPLLLVDLLQTLVATDQSSYAIDLYEANQPLPSSPLISDTMALAYTIQGQWATALTLRPTDLYLLSKRWQQQQTLGNFDQLNKLREKLVYFSAAALEPANTHVLQFIDEAIISLLATGIWQRDEAVYSIAYLLWRHHNSPEIEELVQEFYTHYPDDSASQSFKVELIQRRDQLPLLSSAVGINYEQGLPANLVATTRSIAFDRLSGTLSNPFWHWQVWQGKSGQDALFFSGFDGFESASALRIMNLWQRPGKENEASPYAEYSSAEITLAPNTDYTLSLDYKTDQLGKAVAFVALLDYSHTTPYTFVHTELPDTAGQWQKWQVTGRSDTQQTKVRLLLRMLGTGSVWFDQVQLYKS